MRGASWRKTLRTQRREIRKLLQAESKSPPPGPATSSRDAYPDAVKDAVDETGLPTEHFPSSCPYAPDDVLDEAHLPETSF